MEVGNNMLQFKSANIKFYCGVPFKFRCKIVSNSNLFQILFLAGEIPSIINSYQNFILDIRIHISAIIFLKVYCPYMQPHCLHS